jgi:hypothetical protein
VKDLDVIKVIIKLMFLEAIVNDKWNEDRAKFSMKAG